MARRPNYRFDRMEREKAKAAKRAAKAEARAEKAKEKLPEDDQDPAGEQAVEGGADAGPADPSERP